VWIEEEKCQRERERKREREREREREKPQENIFPKCVKMIQIRGTTLSLFPMLPAAKHLRFYFTILKKRNHTNILLLPTVDA
jgi:hypothetical protein